MKMKRAGLQFLLLVPLFAVLALVVAVPALAALRASLFQDDVFVGGSHYRIILADRAFGYSLSVTMLWMMTTVAGTTVSSLLLARLLHAAGRFRGLLYSMLFIPLGIPIYIVVPVWRAILHGDGGSSLFSLLTGINLNLLNDPAAAFIAAAGVSIWLSVPMTTFVYFSHLKNIPPELYDSIRLETSREATVLKVLQLPMIRSSIMIMVVLNAIAALKEFTLIFLMTGGGVPLLSGITEKYIVGSTTTIGVFLYDIFTGLNSYGITAAYSVIISLLVTTAMGFWFITRIEEPGRRDKSLRWALSAAAFLVMLLRSDGLLIIICSLSLLVTSRWSKVFRINLWALLIAGIEQTFRFGLLAGLSPVIPLVVFVLIVSREERIFEVNRVHDQFTRWLSYVLAALMSFSALLVVYYLLWLSFSGLHTNYVDSFFPPRASFDAYLELFSSEHILSYLKNSAILGVFTALLVPLLVIPAAWKISHMRTKSGDALVSAVQVMHVSSGMHTLIPLFAILALVSMTNSRSALVLIYTAHAVPFALIIMRGHMEKRSLGLEEAAMLDGATIGQYLRHIFIPLSVPMIKTLMLYAWLGAWNGFLAPLVLLSDESRYPLSLKLYSYVGSIASGSPKWHLFAAASVVNLIIIRLLGGRYLDHFRARQESDYFS
jgi:ABC-type glycerol-3-phosphate transport system permease component